MDHFVHGYPDLAQAFIRKLLYFDIFSHPLKAEEIFEYCSIPHIDERQGIRILHELEARRWINSKSGFYFIGMDASKVDRRIEGNQLANLRMKDALKYASIAANFPFVRAVFISGSLSKQVMKPDSDVDFFIITEPEKLWLCRAFLTLYKKLILGNSHFNFCLNYFIDLKNLEIPDKNIFTATEVAFLLPMYNYTLYESFMEKNSWVRAEFPNFKLRSQEVVIQPGSAKKIFEFLFDNHMGLLLDQLSFSVFLGFWKRKFRLMSERSFNLNFRSEKNVSKHHPNAFQEKVVNKLQEKMEAFEQSTGFPLLHVIEIKTF